MLFIVKSYPLKTVAIKTLQQAFRRADSDQALVLIDDGVYYAQQTDSGLANIIGASENLRRSATSMFALQEDMALRGISNSVSQKLDHEAGSEHDTSSITPVSLDAFVALTDTFYPIVYL